VTHQGSRPVTTPGTQLATSRQHFSPPWYSWALIGSW
jgi:hypothetical protein